ncbi:helix-turn-helix domain-containing protein [Haliangium sp.]|uniref:helix-turn-helix domain-containing protein n=1 Tax=Haliangium sp. TaxID=2663208 RepID=UPI003D0E4561
MTLAQVIGAVAAELRRARRWTQTDVAMRIGVSTRRYAKIERGEASPGVDTLARMADLFGFRIDDVLRLHREHVNARVDALVSDTDTPELRGLTATLVEASPEVIALVGSLVAILDPAADE